MQPVLQQKRRPKRPSFPSYITKYYHKKSIVKFRELILLWFCLPLYQSDFLGYELTNRSISCFLISGLAPSRLATIAPTAQAKSMAY